VKKLKKNKALQNVKVANVSELTLSKGDQRRQEIVQATLNCLDHKGVDELTFEAVGREVGLKPPHIAYYFPTKRHLVHAAIRHLMERLKGYYTEALAGLTDPHEMLKKYVDVSFDSWMNDKSLRHLMGVCNYYASRDEEISEIYQSSRLVGVDRVEAMLARMPKFRSVPQDDLRVKAERFLVDLHGRLMHVQVITDKALAERVRKEMRQILADLIAEDPSL
jgi:AcrR family transcriptional regulator